MVINYTAVSARCVMPRTPASTHTPTLTHPHSHPHSIIAHVIIVVVNTCNIMWGMLSKVMGGRETDRTDREIERDR